MKTKVYRVRNDADHINALGELGWEVLSKMPIIVGVPFDMPKDAPILNQWIATLSHHADINPEIRKRLIGQGYAFDKAYVDALGRKAWTLRLNDDSPIYLWRIEFSTTLSPEEEDPILGITFGSPELNIPVFCDKRVIDRYLPKEIIERAIEADSVYEQEMEEDTESKDGGNAPGGKGVASDA